MNKIRNDYLFHLVLLLSLIAILAWSFINCYDFFTWILEAAPAVLGILILIIIYQRFRFTNLAYVLIWLYAIILLVGAHYTYARMPLFNWLRDTFELSRNHYDRLGHLAQGFVPAILAREILLRKSSLRQGGWLVFTVICSCLAISAVYEIFEWLVAVTSGDDAVAFLATQGDVWDTQKDMALCLIGAVTALITLTKPHNKSLKKL